MQLPETPSPIPTVAPGITPTPVTPVPVVYEDVPCSICTPPDSGGDFAMNDMPITDSNRTTDVDFGILGDFGGWLADMVGGLTNWLTAYGGYPNAVMIYFILLAIVFMWLYWLQTRKYVATLKDSLVLERINQIDPDLVKQARVETMFSDLEGRVLVGDWDEDGNSIHDPDRGLRADYV